MLPFHLFHTSLLSREKASILMCVGFFCLKAGAPTGRVYINSSTGRHIHFSLSFT